MSKKILFIFVALIFYLGIISFSNFEKFANNIFQFKFEFLYVIISLSFLTLIIKGFRQQIILKKLGISISAKNNLLLYFAGLSMLVTPGGAGQIVKSYFLKNRFGVQISKSLPLVFVERYNDLIALITMITFTLILIQNYEILMLVLIIWIMVILCYSSLRSKTLFQKIQLLINKLPLLKKRTSAISECYDGLHSSTSGSFIIKTWLLSMIAWIVDAISAYYVFVGFSQNLDFIYTTFVMYTSLFLGFITFLPSGLGVTELSVMGLLTSKGIEISVATSIIILIRLTSIWFSTAIGVVTTKLFLKKSITS